MDVVHTRCAGLDVHKKTVVACRMRTGESGEVTHETQTFGTKTGELFDLVDWLTDWEVSHGAMESPGEDWKPIDTLLEGDIEGLWVKARPVKNVPGRKTDVQDAEGLAELRRHGLLRGSFVPPQVQRDLRDLTRYRTRVVRERTRLVNWMQKLLEGANMKLSSGATDIFGKSGRAMLDALAAGETDAAKIADVARGLLCKKRSELEQALTGRGRPPHQFWLRHQLTHVDFLDGQIATLRQEIEGQMAVVSGDPPSFPSSAGSAGHSPDARDPVSGEPLSYTAAVAFLDTIPGVKQRTAEVIVAEFGTDLRRFPTAKQAAAWSGVAPGNNARAGKRLTGKPREGNQALQDALSEAAWAASRTKHTSLSAR